MSNENNPHLTLDLCKPKDAENGLRILQSLIITNGFAMTINITMMVPQDYTSSRSRNSERNPILRWMIQDPSAIGPEFKTDPKLVPFVVEQNVHADHSDIFQHCDTFLQCDSILGGKELNASDIKDCVDNNLPTECSIKFPRHQSIKSPLASSNPRRNEPKNQASVEAFVKVFFVRKSTDAELEAHPGCNYVSDECLVQFRCPIHALYTRQKTYDLVLKKIVTPTPLLFQQYQTENGIVPTQIDPNVLQDIRNEVENPPSKLRFFKTLEEGLEHSKTAGEADRIGIGRLNDDLIEIFRENHVIGTNGEEDESKGKKRGREHENGKVSSKKRKIEGECEKKEDDGDELSEGKFAPHNQNVLDERFSNVSKFLGDKKEDDDDDDEEEEPLFVEQNL